MILPGLHVLREAADGTRVVGSAAAAGAAAAVWTRVALFLLKHLTSLPLPTPSAQGVHLGEDAHACMHGGWAPPRMHEPAPAADCGHVGFRCSPTPPQVFVCSIVLSLFVSYGIGANDVANAFGSSVGERPPHRSGRGSPTRCQWRALRALPCGDCSTAPSLLHQCAQPAPSLNPSPSPPPLPTGAKALTMKQAIFIAAICEFGGAVLLVRAHSDGGAAVPAWPAHVPFAPHGRRRVQRQRRAPPRRPLNRPAPPRTHLPPGPQGAGVTNTIRSNIANLDDYKVGGWVGGWLGGWAGCCSAGGWPPACKGPTDRWQATFLHRPTVLLPSLSSAQNKPDLYMYGMLCAMLATGIWLLVATYLEVGG